MKGVTSAVSGYTGGSLKNPSYDQVSTGATGHAESVRVTFDPSQVSYADLLRVFFSVATDPTELNYQGPDHGTQYRSVLWYTSARAEEHGDGIHPATREGEGVSESDRDRGEGGEAVLSCRGLSPGLRHAASGRWLHCVQRCAEGREPQAPVPGALSRSAGAGGLDATGIAPRNAHGGPHGSAASTSPSVRGSSLRLFPAHARSRRHRAGVGSNTLHSIRRASPAPRAVRPRPTCSCRGGDDIRPQT